jgi:hypothetical protein
VELEGLDEEVRQGAYSVPREGSVCVWGGWCLIDSSKEGGGRGELTAEGAWFDGSKGGGVK